MRRFRRPLGLAAVWVAATTLLSTVTWQVVGAAEDRVSDAPLSRLVAIPSVSTTGAPAAAPPESASAPDLTAPGPEPAPTPSEPPPSTSPAPALPAEPPVSTVAPWAAETLVTEGGVVLFSYRPESLRLEAVSSVPGWRYEVTEESGTRIEVRFAGHGHDTAVARAEWTDNGLSVDVDDDPDDD